MLTAEQLAARKVGGSDVATIFGLNPYKTAFELYMEKRGELPPPDLSENENVEAGEIFEAPIADLTARRLSRQWGREVKLRRCNLTLVHPQYDWLTVHIDRDFVGEDRGLEIKNVGWRMASKWGEPGSDQVPDFYLPQPHTYMLVKDYPVWTVAAYFGGGDLRCYEIERDKEMDELIVETTHDFHFNHVLKGIPPPPPAESPRALEIVRRLYPGTNGSIVQAAPELEHWRAVYEDAAAKREQYATAADCAKSHLLFSMANAAVLRFADGGTLSRKVAKRKGYTVESCEYIDARFRKAKEE